MRATADMNSALNLSFETITCDSNLGIGPSVLKTPAIKVSELTDSHNKVVEMILSPSPLCM